MLLLTFSFPLLIFFFPLQLQFSIPTHILFPSSTHLLLLWSQSYSYSNLSFTPIIWFKLCNLECILNISSLLASDTYLKDSINLVLFLKIFLCWFNNWQLAVYSTSVWILQGRFTFTSLSSQRKSLLTCWIFYLLSLLLDCLNLAWILEFPNFFHYWSLHLT